MNKVATQSSTKTGKKIIARPRLLIEEWLPAQAIGIECMREHQFMAKFPAPIRLHVWWARRPLTASRAAVLASLLPADFDRTLFERLLGFYASSAQIVDAANLLAAKVDADERISNPYGQRAFNNSVAPTDIAAAHKAMNQLWGDIPTVIDPMAGGGSIPLEAARLGLNAFANEYNPVACSILEATLDYPFRFGVPLAVKARSWGKVWLERFNQRMNRFYAVSGVIPAYTYIFARTVPCPDTGHPTPLVPDWHLLKKRTGLQLVAVPKVTDKANGKWEVSIKPIGKSAGELGKPPQPTFGDGKGVSLFTGNSIPEDYIKAMAKQGDMGSVLYAVAIKANKLDFRPPNPTDFKALKDAEQELARLRTGWEREGIIPTEELSPISNYDRGHRLYGMYHWVDLFSSRQLLSVGVLVEELRRLRPEIIQKEGREFGEALEHLLALATDKFLNFNCNMSRWTTKGSVAGKFDQHNYAFRATYGEFAACVAGGGLEWAIENVIEAYEDIVKLPHASTVAPVPISLGSATNLVNVNDRSVTTVVVDPPYADNVQYAELADFFYVWLKRTQGYRHPEWFASNLCDRDQEAVVNIAFHRQNGKLTLAKARQRGREFYQRLMTDSFKEARRILRDDGVLTVMFTHKEQSAWAALFESIIAADFTITATFPIQTENPASLHQAKKNAAQSTVLLVARKRQSDAGRHFFDDAMKAEIREVARKTAGRLRGEGLNAVDQLVGAFGPAMEVFSRYDEVKSDTGERVSVADAIQIAADAVAEWRVEQLAKRGLDGVDADSRFVLLCWDVLGAAEFRFNEARLLGNAVGMGVDHIKATGLVASSGDKVKMLSAKERRRGKPVRTQEDQLELLDLPKKGRRKLSRKVHPNDEYFVSVIDMCHALALRYAEHGGGDAGIGAAKGMATQLGWKAESPCSKLMDALVKAAPEAVRFAGKGKKKTIADEFPEFRAWHAMLKPLFSIVPAEWKDVVAPQTELALNGEEAENE
jgi:adenine-specific DNA methylase